MIGAWFLLVVTTGSLPIAILALFALAGAIVYSTRIAYTLYRGYQTATNSQAGYLAVGLLLITTVPIALRFVMATLGTLSTAVILIVTAACEIVGLGAILVSIYDPGGDR